MPVTPCTPKSAGRLTALVALMLLIVEAPRVTAQTVLPPDPRPEAVFGTFSICAIDPQTKEVGVAVTTRVPQVGRMVPWVKAGVGGVATQARVEVLYGPRGIELLEQGVAPNEVIKRLLADDPIASSRQLGVIDMSGQTASFTGSENGEFAGSREGKNYTVQGNLLDSRAVIEAVTAVFEATESSGTPLAERLIAALEAGNRAGGDRRKGLKQSAAIKIADPRFPGLAQDHISLDLQVAEHPEPVAELRRQYQTIYQRLGYRTFTLVRGRDVLELKLMLHALGFFRPNDDKLPARSDEPAIDVFDVETADAVDAFRAAQGLPSPADGLGHASGMVDDAFVRALRRAFYEVSRKEAEAQGQSR